MIQIIIVILYIISTILIGVWSKKKAHSSKAYDGVALSLGVCVVAGAGEWLGGTATTGVSEYGYTYGLSGAWYTIANGIGICFLASFFSKMFRKLNTPTVSGIIGKYIGQKARAVSSVLLILVMIMVGVSQMVSLGLLGEALLGLNAIWSIIILGSSVLIYTVLGGMQAVGYTNIMHMLIMYAGGIVALILSANKIGWNEMQEVLPESYFAMNSIGWNKIIAWILASVLGACTAQAGLQPILGAKDEKTAVRSSYLIAVIVAPFGIMMALLGMFAKIEFPNLNNAKMALPLLLMSMPPLAGGLVIASIFAAILSTASPIFLACGTLCTRDIYLLRKKNEDDRHVLFVSRFSTLLSGFCCILLAIVIKDATAILDLVYFAYSIRGAIFIVLLFGIYWKKISPKSAILAMIMSGGVGLVWVIYKMQYGHYPIHPQLSETYIALITSIIVTVVGSLISRETLIN